MSGASSDATSGLSGAQISLDGGTTWQPISLNSDGSWSYTWDTTTASDGPHGVLVSAADQAGNQEHTARITVIVANLGPSVSISDSFLVSQDVPVQFSPGILPITGARILVSDGGGHTRTYTYSPASLPTSFQWDGLWDDGTQALPGDYQVEASAWDMFGNTAHATGAVQVPTPSPTPNALSHPDDNPSTGKACPAHLHSSSFIIPEGDPYTDALPRPPRRLHTIPRLRRQHPPGFRPPRSHPHRCTQRPPSPSLRHSSRCCSGRPLASWRSWLRLPPPASRIPARRRCASWQRPWSPSRINHPNPFQERNFPC